MTLFSDNIQFIPLSAYQFKLLLNDIKAMETNLNLCYSGEDLNANQWCDLALIYQLFLKNKDSSCWYTNFQAVLKSKNVSIGSFCLTGKPNEDAVLYLKLYLYSNFKSTDTIHETLKILHNWASAQYKIKKIIAICDNEMYIFNAEQGTCQVCKETAVIT